MRVQGKNPMEILEGRVLRDHTNTPKQILTEKQKQFNGRGVSFWMNGFGSIGHPLEKK